MVRSAQRITTRTLALFEKVSKLMSSKLFQAADGIGGDSRNDRNETRNILGRVLGPEYQGTSNTTNSTQSSKCGTAERPPPLASNVVCLIRHSSRDVGISARNSQKRSKQAYTRTTGKAHDRKADDGNAGVEDDDWGTHMPFVTCPCSDVHEDGRENIRGSRKTLRSCDAESEIVP